MLKSRIRNAAAAARPVKIRGVAVTSVCVSDPSWTNAALKSLRYVANGLWPVISRTSPAIDERREQRADGDGDREPARLAQPSLEAELH